MYLLFSPNETRDQTGDGPSREPNHPEQQNHEGPQNHEEQQQPEELPNQHRCIIIKVEDHLHERHYVYNIN